MNPTKVFIATPTAGGVVTTAYANTLVTITLELRRRKINYLYSTLDGSDIVIARNYLANSFVQNNTCSHILFVDSDMAISQETLAMMLDSGKDFVGTIYPERRLDLEKYGAYIRKGRTDQAALALSLKFNVRHVSSPVAVVDGLCRVNGLGFGCVLIAKPVFERLIATNGVKKMVSPKLRDTGLGGDVYDFFGQIALKNGDRLSEDYSFCQRVNRGASDEIWAVVGGSAGHVGRFTYGAPYIEFLKAQDRPKPIPAAASTSKH